MGICRLSPTLPARRIDILLTDPEQYPFALLYFTGSDKFNIQMRKHAAALGYRLNEHGLVPVTPAAEKVKMPAFRTEKDIFSFLKYAYVDPINRK